MSPMKSDMSRSYRKNPVNCPAHAKLSDIGRLCWKKALRRKIKNCRDADGTPVLPHKIGICWPIKNRRGRFGAFGYGSYDKWAFGVTRIGGRLVSTGEMDDDLYPGYSAKKIRTYYNK